MELADISATVVYFQTLNLFVVNQCFVVWSIIIVFPIYSRDFSISFHSSLSLHGANCVHKDFTKRVLLRKTPFIARQLILLQKEDFLLLRADPPPPPPPLNPGTPALDIGPHGLKFLVEGWNSVLHIPNLYRLSFHVSTIAPITPMRLTIIRLNTNGGKWCKTKVPFRLRGIELVVHSWHGGR